MSGMHFTAVLRGHAESRPMQSSSMAVPAINLDYLARQPLWETQERTSSMAPVMVLVTA